MTRAFCKPGTFITFFRLTTLDGLGQGCQQSPFFGLHREILSPVWRAAGRAIPKEANDKDSRRGDGLGRIEKFV